MQAGSSVFGAVAILIYLCLRCKRRQPIVNCRCFIVSFLSFLFQFSTIICGRYFSLETISVSDLNFNTVYRIVSVRVPTFCNENLAKHKNYSPSKFPPDTDTPICDRH